MTKITTTPPLHVALVGMNERAENALRIIFSKIEQGFIFDSDKVDVIIIDRDNINALQLWQTTRKRHPNARSLILTHSSHQEGDGCLRKPYKSTELYAMARSLYEVEASHSINQEPMIDEDVEVPPFIHQKPTIEGKTEATPLAHQEPMIKENMVAPPLIQQEPKIEDDVEAIWQALYRSLQNQEPSIKENVEETSLIHQEYSEEERKGALSTGGKSYYDPHKYLQHLLHKAASLTPAKNVAVLIEGQPHAILFTGSPEEVYTKLSDEVLKSFCQRPLRTGLISMRPFTPTTEQMLLPSVSTEDFLWKVSEWTSRGRLPAGCDPERPMHLKRLPNLTHLSQIPHALRLSSIWSSQAISPMQMISRLDIPAKNVFDFFSACHALALMQPCADEIPVQAINSEPDGGHPLLSWIKKRYQTRKVKTT